MHSVQHADLNFVSSVQTSRNKIDVDSCFRSLDRPIDLTAHLSAHCCINMPEAGAGKGLFMIRSWMTRGCSAAFMYNEREQNDLTDGLLQCYY